MRILSVGLIASALSSIAFSTATAADPAHDLVGKTYQVETTADGAVNVAIDYNRVGYGVISPSRLIGESGGLPGYRLETLADARGISVLLAARLRAHLSATVDEWQVVSAIAAPKVSSDSNLSFDCPGNSATADVVALVYYDGGRKGRSIAKVTEGFALNRRTGQVSEMPKPPLGCKATEDPL